MWYVAAPSCIVRAQTLFVFTNAQQGVLRVQSIVVASEGADASGAGALAGASSSLPLSTGVSRYVVNVEMVDSEEARNIEGMPTLQLLALNGGNEYNCCRDGAGLTVMCYPSVYVFEYIWTHACANACVQFEDLCVYVRVRACACVCVRVRADVLVCT